MKHLFAACNRLYYLSCAIFFAEAGATVNTGMQAKQLAKCWYRLVITANAMATMCIEKEDYVTALRILELAKTWALNEEVLLRKNTCQVRTT